LQVEINKDSAKMERATGIEPVLPAWELKFSILYFQYLQIHSEQMYVHALHTVHAVPDLRIAAGRFAGRFMAHLNVYFVRLASIFNEARVSFKARLR
jgi:hypothetical protein